MNIKNIGNLPIYFNKDIKTSGVTTPNSLSPSFKSHEIKSDKVELSEKAEFIKTLDKNYVPMNVNIKFDGETSGTPFIKYIGSRFGTNPAFWARNPIDNKLYYVKYGRNDQEKKHIEAEILASKLYNLAGIKTPEIKPCLLDYNETALASEYVSGMKSISNPKDAHIGFAADAWLANWDSLIDDNTVIVGDEIVKIDNGGALEFRAQGKYKTDFDSNVKELLTLVDGTNYESKSIYSSISYQTLINSFERVCSISDKAIQDVVKDKYKANILINRRNYMARVFENIKTTPYDGKNIVDYMKIVTQGAEKNEFDAVNFKNEFLKTTRQIIYHQDLTTPSTKTIYKILTDLIKSKEKMGIEISKEQLIDLFSLLNNISLERFSSNKFQNTAQFDNLKKIFTNLQRMASKTPQKDRESASKYLNRIINMCKKRQKQLDDFRIKNIKDRLLYEQDKEISVPVISDIQKNLIIEEINKRIKNDYESFETLSDDASIEEILSYWSKMCIGSNEVIPLDLNTLLVYQLDRYCSSEKPVNKMSDIFFNDEFVTEEYSSEFKYEPVYRWMNIEKIDDFINNFPKNGQEIVFDKTTSCSMNKFYAEDEYNDNVPTLNVKYIIHPKSKTSRARVLGINQEVLYAKDAKFRVLDKELVEYEIPKTGQSIFRWEIHLQEV